MKLVSDAVYARCDAKDGLKDGLIDDPRRCDFPTRRATWRNARPARTARPA